MCHSRDAIDANTVEVYIYVYMYFKFYLITTNEKRLKTLIHLVA